MTPQQQQPQMVMVPQQTPQPPPTENATQVQTPTPASGRKKGTRKGTGLSTTGYTIFSASVNKQVNLVEIKFETFNGIFFKVREEHPSAAFGELSRLIGEKWRALEGDLKKEFEEKAKIKVKFCHFIHTGGGPNRRKVFRHP